MSKASNIRLDNEIRKTEKELYEIQKALVDKQNNLLSLLQQATVKIAWLPIRTQSDGWVWLCKVQKIGEIRYERL